MKNFYIYIMTSAREVLYIGMTNNLYRRVYEHKHGIIEGFSKKYKCNRLIYFEQSNDVNTIISREKQLKKWSRMKKVKLINEVNPSWSDLSLEFTDLSTSSR